MIQYICISVDKLGTQVEFGHLKPKPEPDLNSMLVSKSVPNPDPNLNKPNPNFI